MNLSERARIAAASTPGLAKRAGRAVELRKDWEKVKVDIMRDAVELKFAIPELREKLLATGDANFIEGNTWHDNFWGKCTCPKCKNLASGNRLGVLLRQTRNKIQKEK